MKIVYVTLNFLPAGLRGSEWLSYRFGKSALQVPDTKVFVITTRVKSYIGFFFPFIARFKKKEEAIEQMHIIRLPHNWLIFSLANCLLVFITFIRLLPFFKRSTHLDSLYANAAQYAFGVVLKGLKDALETVDPDIVHVTPIPQIYVLQTINQINAWNKTREKKIKLVLTPAMHFHRDIVKETYPIKNIKRAFNLVDTIICTTQFEKRQIEKIFEVSSEKIQVVNIGVTRKKIESKKNDISMKVKEILRKVAKQKTNDVFILFFLGTRCSKKGLFQLIKTIHGFESSEKEKMVLLVGGQITITWKFFIFFSNWQKKYPFLINLPYLNTAEKEAVFALADVFVMPSIVDSYGIVYVEAMAASLPILACTEPPQMEIIGNGGLYNDFSDLKKLEENIRLLMDDPLKRGKLGLHSSHLYEEKYTEMQMFKKMKDIYQKILYG